MGRIFNSEPMYRESGPPLFENPFPQSNPPKPIPQLAPDPPWQIKNCSGKPGGLHVGGDFCKLIFAILPLPHLTLKSVLLSGVTAVAGGLQS